MVENKRNRVLIAGSVMQLFLGIIYVWSVFVAPVTEYFNMDINTVKLTSSFMLCFFVMGILFGGRLQVKISTQKTVLIGGILLSVAMFATSMLPKDLGMLIFFTYGIVGGFGVGMGYNAIISTAQRNFPDKRGFATGISVCTFGFSTVIFAPLIQVLATKISLQNIFIILGSVFLVATLICFSFITMPKDTDVVVGTSSTQKDYSTKEMLKTNTFYLITLAMMFGTSVYFILNPSFKTLSLERGLSDNMATIMIMLTGVSNAVGRLIFPIISDKTSRSFSCLLTLIFTTIGAFMLIFAQGYVLMAVVILIAFCYGGTSGAFPLVTGKFFGLKNIGSNYGCIMVGFSLSALLFPIALSLVNNQIVLFVILGVVALLGTLALVPLLKREKSI